MFILNQVSLWRIFRRWYPNKGGQESPVSCSLHFWQSSAHRLTFENPLPLTLTSSCYLSRRALTVTASWNVFAKPLDGFSFGHLSLDCKDILPISSFQSNRKFSIVNKFTQLSIKWCLYGYARILFQYTVVFSQNRTLAILWSKMAFFTMAWRGVKVLQRPWTVLIHIEID